MQQAGYTATVTALYLTISSLFALMLLPLTMLIFVRLGRRMMLIVYSFASSICLIVLGNISHHYAPTTIVMNSLVLFFLSSIGGSFPPYVSELFPTEMRGWRCGLVLGAGKIAGLVGSLGVSAYLKSGSSQSMFSFLAATLAGASCLLCAVSVETEGLGIDCVIEGNNGTADHHATYQPTSSWARRRSSVVPVLPAEVMQPEPEVAQL
jgi:peptidoglycan/LPS O-acetylase OafA/YrhL